MIFFSTGHGEGVKLEPKWYLPLHNLRFHPPEAESEWYTITPIMCDAFIIYIYVLILFSRSFFFTAALRPVPVTSDQELSVIKSRIAELKAQLNREFKEKRSSTLDKDASFVR